MPVPPETGFPAADAQDDFLRARRRATLARLARFLARDPGDVDVVLPFDEVVSALGRVGERDLGLHTVALDSIVGSVDRPKGFDRQFRPTTSLVRARWERIANAARRGEALPPVSLYRIGEVHFVRDGHHRVSVARAMGRGDIDAYLTEVLTRVGADKTLQLADLPFKTHERVFLERVPLPDHARGRVQLSDPSRYPMLAEAIEAWGFRLTQEQHELLDRPAMAELWFDDEFVPVVNMLREADMIGRGTEADAYMRVAEERYRLMRTHEWNPEVLARIRGDA